MSSPKIVLAREPDTISWQRTADWVEAKSSLLAIALCVCFAGISLAIAARRPFWYDEIITISIARAPSIKDVLASFHLIYEQTPPLNTFLVRFMGSLFGWSELVARLPSIIFVTSGLLLIFHRVRALTNGLFGLAAVSILLVSFLPDYAYEARPYALLFFAATLAIWFWTSATTRGRDSLRSSLFFGLSMGLAVSAHYYAALLILPFAADELRSRGLQRILSIRLISGIAGLGLALAIHLPLIRAASRMRAIHFWALPSLRALEETYSDMLFRLVLAFVCVVVLLAWVAPKPSANHPRQSPQERLGWFFLALPIAGYLLAELATHAFTPRYFIATLSGLALALGCVLYRYYCETPQVPLLILLVTIPLFVQASASKFHNASTPVVSGRMDESDFVDEMLPHFRQDKKRDVLVSPGRIYLESRYYAADPTMICTPRSLRYPAAWLASGILRIRYLSDAEIFQKARETAFVNPSADLLKKLETRGFHIHWRMVKPEPVVYVD